MPNEPLSTQNYVQIGDKVLNRTADASITTNDVSLSDRIFVFKKNEDGSIKTVVNTTIQYIVDAFSADATAIKNSTKEYCDGIKADTSQLKADTEALKNAAVTAKTSAESARDSAISAKNSASTSATNASNSASSASASATTATTKASEASASASSASKSATSASTSASNASSSASSASASATSANNSASTATTKASEASNSANQAKGYRDETQQLSEQFNPASILLAVYPVGSIYMSVNSTDPSSLFGGGWTRLKDRFLLAAGDSYAAGNTGGEASHKLTLSEIPSHSHTKGSMRIQGSVKGVFFGDSNETDGVFSVSGKYGAPWKTGSGADERTVMFNTDTGGWSGFTSNEGGSSAHNNMPPYITVYVWKRIE